MTTYIDGREQNPWGLTATEIKAMDAVIAHGSVKRAAAALNLEPDTIKGYTHTGGRKIAPNDKLTRYILWDRWRNGVLK